MKKIFLILFFVSLTFSQTRTVGLIENDSTKSFKGYTLFSPTSSTYSYLIDINGNLIQSWKSNYKPGQAVMLLSNGDLLRTATPGGAQTQLNGGGAGGIVEKYDWNGNLIWSFNYYGASYRAHHDIEILPNNNILLIVWEKKTLDEAISKGRKNIPQSVTEIWSEKIVEVKQTGANSGSIVWEWNSWDHLAQDADQTKPNYFTISDHPELIDINSAGTQTDWLHINSIRYNSKFDQILLSVHNSNEIWIIDHSTTTTEATGHTGGKSGKGGDLLYRWGNPISYKRGTASDQKLFAQHDARWIDSQMFGGDNILIFNNGQGRTDGNYSTLEEITPPVDSVGKYFIASNSSFGPSATTWFYKAQNKTDFYSQNISGATRLENNNTLICAGTSGTFFEITKEKNIVWKYINPVTQNGILYQGQVPTNNMVFKIYRYAPSYSAFTGRSLNSKGPIEQYQSSVDENISPKNFKLEQNFPNPFNPTTIIKYELPKNCFVSIKIYDLFGREISNLVNENKQAGRHNISWNAKDLKSGVYFVKLTADKFSQINKALFLQ